MLFRFNTSDLEARRLAPRGGFATVSDMRTYALLNLVWSAFVLSTPFQAGTENFPHWLWPTLSSYVAFLWLYFRLFFRGEREPVTVYAWAIAALGFLVMPFNPGAQGYLIYSCAVFAFAGPMRQSVQLMALMLGLFTLEWW